MGHFHGKQNKMSNLSPSTVAINTIAHCLANAMDASAGLDPALSADLRALLHISSGEIDRVRKANRKAVAAVKRAGQSGKKSGSKSARKAETKAEVEEQPKPAKSKGRSRKAVAVNGAVTH